MKTTPRRDEFYREQDFRHSCEIVLTKKKSKVKLDQVRRVDIMPRGEVIVRRWDGDVCFPKGEWRRYNFFFEGSS
jgi:hypothetical protein